MRVVQVQGRGLDDPALAGLDGLGADLVLTFAAPKVLAAAGAHARLTQLTGGRPVVGCSTSGEITGEGLAENGVVLTAITFDHSTVRVAETRLVDMQRSFDAGAQLGRSLAAADLTTVMLFAKGVAINGSELVRGLEAALGRSVLFSGGLAGDYGAFRRTLTVTPTAIDPDGVVAVGVYGTRLRLGHGSFGGWRPFGPLRRVTRAVGNVLYELDGQPALRLYRDYLGEYADDLPSSGMKFPLEMVDSQRRSSGLIRTILGVDEQAETLILAGDIDTDGYFRLMHTDADGLVDGAEIATCRALAGLAGCPPQLILLVSCVGRKLVMGERIDDEIEAVGAIVGHHYPLSGFYANGEVGPDDSMDGVRLHNQTMTVTLMAEI